MATHQDVLSFLRPEGGYAAYGLEYEGIQFLECKSFTKEEYLAAFDEFEAAKSKQDLAKATAKAALLDRLGITADEAALLLG